MSPHSEQLFSVFIPALLFNMRFYTLFITHPYKFCCKNEVINFFIGFSVVHTIMKPECFANNNEYVLPLAL